MIKKETNIFNVGASYTIGSYILPGTITSNLNDSINTKIKVHSCLDIIKGVKAGEFNLGLVESPIFDNELIYQPWIDNEFVICSKVQLPKNVSTEQLIQSHLICREKDSPTRQLIADFFKKMNLSYESFKSYSEINNATVAVQSVKWTKPNIQNPTITIVSKFIIEYEVKHKELFQSRIQSFNMNHNFYLVYRKDQEKNSTLQEIITQLMKETNKIVKK